MDEEQAIAKLKAGSIDGLEVLVRAYYVRAVRVAYLITRDRPLAEDVVQEAFIRAYERIGQFDARRPFAPWFLRSVTNAAMRAAERQHRYTVWPADDPEGYDTVRGAAIDADPLPDELIQRAETQQEIWAALGQLPAAQRAATVRRYYLELSENEIASVTDSPPGTVKWRLHAARERLRMILRPS